jgi:hypothetical protein
MCNADNNQNENIFTFWKLINNYEIEIPLIQREYAQGRNDNAVKSIRDNLLKEIFEVLQSDNKERKDLNFIYGSIQNGKFIPIDGQQRLTTLFLLHWYVLYRNNQYGKDDWYLLKKFSYQTRTTSKNFCLNICNKTEKIDFAKEKISEQIEDMSWFTPNYKADPTVKSMLNMLEEIHQYVKNKITEWKNIKDNLLHNGKVYFLFLSLENNNANHGNAANAINVSNFEDLYMKMNARGKQLTDFEIFKAKLQDSKEIMTELCKAVRENDDATEVNDTEIINYISKYNNEFADLFYKIADNDFDKEMFAFFKLMIATNIFSKLDSAQRNNKKTEYQSIKTKTGSELFSYILDSKNITFAKEALKQIHKFLEIISTNQDIPEKDKQEILICSKADLFKDIRIFAITTYLIKFKNSLNVQEYREWKRFVNNILENIELKNVEGAYTTCTVLNTIIDQIHDNNGKVLQTIKDIATTHNENYPLNTAFKGQFIEEKIKAGLMYNYKNWESSIKDAEQYFNSGHISFLLCISKKGDHPDLEKFNKNFLVIKKFITGEYKIKGDRNSQSLINDVLLTYSNTNSCHISQIQKDFVFVFWYNEWSIYGKYKTHKQLFQVKWEEKTQGNYNPESGFIMPLEKFCEELSQDQNLDNFLKIKIKSTKENLFKKSFVEIGNCKENWKEKWILLEKDHKQPTIDLRRLDYIYLFDGIRNIKPSYELNTCLLYSYIKHNLGEDELQPPVPVPYQDVLDENKLPRRYFTFKGWNIAFCPESDKGPWWIWKDETVIGRYSTAEIYDEIKKL